MVENGFRGTSYPIDGVLPTQPPTINMASNLSSPTPTQLPQIPNEPKKPPFWKQDGFLRTTKIVGVALLILALISGLIVFFGQRPKQDTPNVSLANEFSSVEIPLSGFAGSSANSILGTRSLTVNGSLISSGGFVISPSGQPSTATTGQIYYDQTNNQLAYFNGSQYVALGGGVLAIQGQTGNVTLVGGPGIAVNGTQLSNTGVTSLGGGSGDITIGPGLSLTNNTLQNSGIISATAGSNIGIIDDGAGNITISNTGSGTGTVTSAGGTVGKIAMFTGAQNIEDSLISQSGMTVTVNGDLSVITGGLSLANALTVSNGGTGTTSLAANGVVVASGTAPLTAVTAVGPGLCFVSTAGAPAFAACPGGGGVTSLNGLTGALNVANASAAGSTITIDDASNVTKGIASFNASNFSAAAGVINTIQDINTTAAPTFGRLTLTSGQATNPMLVINNTNVGATGNLLDVQLNGASRFAVTPAGVVTTAGTINGQTISGTGNFTGTLGVAGAVTTGGILNANGGQINSTGALSITPTGTLTLGSSVQTLSLQGGSSSSMVITSGANTTTVNFQAPTAAVTYRIATAAAGSYDFCTTAGNCTGVGGGVTTGGGTVDRLAKFSSAQGIADSSISDNGTTVTTTANLVVQGGSMTVGVANSQTGTLSLAYGSANFSGVITQGALTANRTYTLPDVDGTFCFSSGNCLGGGGGGANTSLSNLTSVAINTALLPGSTTIDLGSSTAPFRNVYIAGSSVTPGTNNFTITGTATAGRTITLPDATGTVCLQTAATCGFATGSGVAILQGGNTLGVAANIGTNDNFALNLRTNGATQVSVATTGNTTFNADIAVNGGDITSTGALNITPGGTLTVGATGQALVLQGNASTQLTASGGGFTTTIGFTGSPTADVTYNFDRTPSAGSYTVCSTAGNCSSVGGGVTVSSNGTIGTLPVFTGAQTIADSLISQSGSVVTANGDINLTTGHVYKINNAQISSADLSNNSDLAKLASSQTFTGATNAFQNGANSTNAFNIQNAGGTRILTVDTTNGQVTLGTASTLSGRLVFNNVANANTVTFQQGTLTGNRTLTLPDASGIICTDAGNCNGVGSTLQTAYNFSTGGTTPKIKLNGTLLGFDIQDADTTIGANLLNVRASNGSGLGSVMFGIGNTGAATFQNSANSTTALQVLTQGGTSVVTIDSQNGQALLGQGGTLTGTLVFNNSTNSNQITLTSAVATGARTITLPDATGTVCLTSGNCSGGGSSNTLQAAYDAGNTILSTNNRDVSVALADTATDANFLIDLQCDTSCSTNGRFAVQDDAVDIVSVAPTLISLGSASTNVPVTISSGTGAINIGDGAQARAVNIGTGAAVQTVTIGSTDTTSTTLIQSGSGNITLNSGGTIALQDTTTIAGNLTVTGTATSALVVKASTNGSGAIVADFQQSDNDSIMRLTDNGTIGLGNSTGIAGILALSSGTAFSEIRATNITAARILQLPNQDGTLCVSNAGTTNCDTSLQGSYTASTGGTTPEIRLDATRVGIDIQDANSSIGSGQNFLSMRSSNAGGLGTIVFGVGIQGNLYMAPSTDRTDLIDINNNAGNNLLTVDSSNNRVGIALGSTNLPAFTLDVGGTLNVAGVITAPTLGAASTATYLCRNGSNQISTCNSTGTGVAFIQGGNSLGATATFGTNDANGIDLEVNNVTVATLSSTGAANFLNQTNSATAFRIQSATGAETLFTADTTNRGAGGGNLIKIGNSTGTDTALTILQLDSASADPTTNLAALNGGLFYNSNTNKVSIIENGTVKVICNTTDLGCGAGAATLQTAYANGSTISTTGNNIGFTLNSGQDFTVSSTDSGSSALFSGTTTTGTVLDLSNATAGQTTATLLNVSSSGYTTGYTGNVVNIQGTSTTGASNLLNLSSANTTAGNGLNLTADTLTTGNGVNINSAGTGLTTGSLLKVSSATTGAINTNGIVSLQASGNYTSTSNNGLLNVLASSTTAGTIANIQGSSLTSGVALNIGANTGTAIRVSSGLTTLTNATSGSGTTLNVSNSTSTGSIVVFQDNATTVASIADGGAALFQNQSDSTTGFRVLNAGAVPLFVVDTSNSRAYVGNPSSDTTGALLVLDTKSDSGDPTGVNGGMYYSTNTNTFRCYENSVWYDCISRHKIVLGSDVADSSGVCTNTNITGLSFSVTSGQVYRFYALLEFTTGATTTGVQWTATTPASNYFSLKTSNPTSDASNDIANINVSDGGNCSAGTFATTGNLATMEGIVAPSANGTLQLRFASETNGTAITVKAGSTLEWW